MKKKILIVDDEESLLRMFKLNLEGLGKYEVRTESKGAKALEVARNFKPDLVFLDIVMPDLEGSEVAEELKSDRDLRSVPIVFLTATVTAEEVETMGNRIGDQVFLAKPVTLKQLVDCIEINLHQK